MTTKDIAKDVKQKAHKVLFAINKLGGIYEQCEYCDYAAVRLVDNMPMCDVHGVKVGEFLDPEL